MDLMRGLAMLVALVVLVPPSAFLFSWTPIGRALTQRLKGQTQTDGERLEEALSTIFEMQRMIDGIGADLYELQERVSFAERLLTTKVEQPRELTPV